MSFTTYTTETLSLTPLSAPTTIGLSLPPRRKAPEPPDMPYNLPKSPLNFTPFQELRLEYANLNQTKVYRLATQFYDDAKIEITLGGTPIWSRLSKVPRWFLILGINASRGSDNRGEVEWMEPMIAWERLLDLERYQREPSQEEEQRGRQIKREEEEEEEYDFRLCGEGHETFRCAKDVLTEDKDDVGYQEARIVSNFLSSGLLSSNTYNSYAESVFKSEKGAGATRSMDKLTRLDKVLPCTNQACSKYLAYTNCNADKTQRNPASTTNSEITMPALGYGDISNISGTRQCQAFNMEPLRAHLSLYRLSSPSYIGDSSPDGGSDSGDEKNCMAGRFGPDSCGCRSCRENAVTW